VCYSEVMNPSDSSQINAIHEICSSDDRTCCVLTADALINLKRRIVEVSRCVIMTKNSLTLLTSSPKLSIRVSVINISLEPAQA
jgi:hypothetical protein